MYNGQPTNGQPNNGYQPPIGGGYVVEERNIALCIILSIITCGIYWYYWIYKMNEDLNVVSNRRNDASGATVIILSIITCGIYLWYWMYKAGEKLNTAGLIQGRNISNNGVVYLILCIFTGIGSMISSCLIQSELNNLKGLY